MTSVAAPTSGLAPYLPRLLRAWSEEEVLERARSIEGTLVSIDISGFTALAEQLATNGRAGAEELVTQISAVFDELIRVAERHGGDVLKFRGDALLLFFVGERHAERGCGAASDMQWTIGRVGVGTSSVGPFELKMSVGVHTDICHFFLTETPHRELLVGGRAATRVFELEDLASAEEIVVSAETAAALDPSWIDGERDGAFLMRRLEPGASVIPPPPAAAGQSLERFVPTALRDHLAVASGEAEHRMVTVAFVKLSGTDDLIESEGPQALLAELDIVAAAVAEASVSYGVTWLESDIDVNALKLYLTAGAPSTTGDDAEGMLRSLRHILAAHTRLPVRAGVNRGAVFTGDIGATARRTYAVMGDAVNLAARLTARAQPVDLLATDAVLENARTTFATEQEPFLVKGKERAIMAHHVGEPTGTRPTDRLDDLPLIGRDDELATLKATIDAARMRRLQAVEIVADAGMGKSRLVAELRTLALGFQQVTAAVDPYAATVPYSIWPDLLRPLVGILPTASREEAGAQLAPWILAVAPDLAPWLPLLAIAFDADVPASDETDALDPANRRERLHATVESLLERLLMMPTLLVVEDTHWLDDASTLLLQALVAKPAPRPWLVLITTRPGAVPIVPAAEPGSRLVLSPLAPEQAQQLALVAAGDAALAPDVMKTLTERGAGNPLFLRELVTAAEGGDAGELPESVEALLTTRIDTLPPADRMLLRCASVLGPVFELPLLTTILGDEINAIDDPERWGRLAEFVSPTPDGSFAFRHDLMRTTAYEGLSFRRRREIHGRVGLALEERAGARADEEAALLSLHFAEAGDHERAWRYAVSAGRRARSDYANVVASRLFDRALAAADALDGTLTPAEVADVAEALGDVCEHFAAYDRAAAAYGRVLELLPNDPVVETRIAAKRGVLHERVAEYDAALETYRAALARLDELPSEPELQGNRAELEIGSAAVHYRQGRFEEASEWAQTALAHAESNDDRDRIAHASYLIAAALNELGLPGGIEYCERALAIYEELGDHVGMGRTLNNLGIRLYYEGRWDEAVVVYRRGAEELARAGEVVSEATLRNNEGEVLSDQGRLDEALEPFEGFVRVCRAGGYALGEGAALSNLGRLHARAGRFTEAHAAFEQALEIFARIGAQGFELETSARRAECYVFEGRYAEALELVARPDFADAGAAVRILVERTWGYALYQARRPTEGLPHLQASLGLAGESGSEYESVLSLRALALTKNRDAEELAEAEAALERRGVVSVPKVPLP